MSFKTAKRYRGGRKREKPQAFPVGGKKKLPKKPKYPAKRKASEKDFATVDRFINLIAPAAEAKDNPEIQKARSAWSRVRAGIGSMKDFHLLDDFVDVLAPEYMAKDPGIRKGRRAWGRILLAAQRKRSKSNPLKGRGALKLFSYGQSGGDEYGSITVSVLAGSKKDAIDRMMQVPIIGRYASRNWIRDRIDTLKEPEDPIVKDPKYVYLFETATIRKNIITQLKKPVFRKKFRV